jgi:large subunit ribosomal protein L23
VRVKAVNTMNVKGSRRSRAIRRGRGRIYGQERAWKKAVVTLFPGQRIDVFEQV